MEKIILFIMSICFSNAMLAQDSLKKTIHNIIECGCPDIPSDYGDEYRSLDNESWDYIKKKLDTLLNVDIDESRDKGLNYEAWNMLRRIKDITWTTNKKNVLDYLNKFIKNILEGKGYLTTKNKNILYDNKGCPFRAGDPVSFPLLSYQIIMQIDANYGIKIINETWDSLIVNDTFSSNFRNNVITILSKYYKSDNIKSLLNKLLLSEISNTEIQAIKQILLSHELSKSRNQKDAWKMVVSHNRKNSSLFLSVNDGDKWSDCITILYNLFGDRLDIAIPLQLGEKEENSIIKYWLAYSVCYIGNGSYPNKSSEVLIKRIHKLVESVQNLNKREKFASDYLNETYTAFKKWH